MGFLQRLGGWGRQSPAPEKPSPSRARFALLDGPWSSAGIWQGTGTTYVANVPRVSRDEALQVPAVLRGRNLIAGQLATLPLRCVDTDNRSVRLSLLEQIDPDVPNVVTIAETLEDLLFEGVSWWEILAFGWDGYPVQARHLDVKAVSTSPPEGYPLNSLPSGIFPDGTVWVAGRPVPPSNMIRFDSPNPPLLVHGARAIRRALKLERTADRYADDPRMLGFFTPQEGADPVEDDEVEEILDDWEDNRRKRVTGYVPAALKYNSAEQLSPADLQLADLMLKANLALANALGIDPEDLGISTTSRTYQNAVDRRVDRTNETYGVYLRALSERLSMGDVTPRGKRVVHDLDDFLKANPLERWNTYAVAHGMGALTVPEIRAEEDLPPLPAGAAAPVAAPRLAPVPTPQEPRMAAHRTVQAAFTAAPVTFEMDTSASFAVDTERRIMSGVAIPYGPNAIARYDGRRYRFERGSVVWPGNVQRVKHLRDHDMAQAVGRAASIDDTDRGLFVRLKVGRGPEGDRLLQLAEDGVQDGLSVGVDIEQTVPDPLNPGVLLVKRARLHEVSSTAMPAFDDARVTDVAASRSQEGEAEMPPENTPQGGTAVAEPVDTAAFTRAVEAFTSAVERLGEGRQVVNPTARAQVVEPAVYTLDGTGFSFVHDSWTARNAQYGSRDHEDAVARLRKYQDQTATFATDPRLARFANAGNTTDQADIIPPGYRPDLYVGQLPKGRVLFEAVSRGRITNATPFKIPFWKGSANLSGTNTEGTGPSTGTITDHDYITVTPTAQSGEFVVTRELMDAANPAIDQIALAAMREEYARDTETVIAAAIETITDDGTGAVGGTASAEGAWLYTTADDDGSDTAAAVRVMEGAYSSHRRGAPNRMTASATGFGSLVSAVDTTGRPLFPFLAAQNAYGVVGQAAQTINVDGLSCQPSGEQDNTSNHILLFNSADLWAWESGLLQFRFDEKGGPENIFLNIWGYFAFAILRPASIHSLKITAAG